MQYLSAVMKHNQVLFSKDYKKTMLKNSVTEDVLYLIESCIILVDIWQVARYLGG